MKKLFAMILVIALAMTAVAIAEEDNEFMGLSYVELMGKLGKVQRALWASDGWTSVDVQAGIYKIGEDIPAGHWVISPAKYDDFYTIGYGTKLNRTGTDLDTDSIDGWWNISSDYSDSLLHSLDITLEDGYYLQLSHMSTFKPYSGKPNPQFHFD